MGKGVNMLPAQLEFCTTTGMKSAKKKKWENVTKFGTEALLESRVQMEIMTTAHKDTKIPVASYKRNGRQD